MNQDKIYLDIANIDPFIRKREFDEYEKSVHNAHSALLNKKCSGNEFLGWLDLPEKIADDEILAIEQVAQEIRSNSDHLLVIGIGGSYLGARSAIEFILPSFRQGTDRVLFAGHHLGTRYIQNLLNFLAGKELYVNVISKSGGTTEPAVAFRLALELMKSKYEDEKLKNRIIATTDPEKGMLRSLAQKAGYRTFAIPADVGGRFSVLTPVGLLPIAAAGLNIREMLRGARDMAVLCKSESPLSENPALLYAAIRNKLYQQGRKVEILASFEPNLQFIGEWWKQLYGESEGKDNKGIFPASVNFTTDLHSLGQYIQEGERILFETFINIEKDSGEAVTIKSVADDPDGLNYLEGKSLEEVNKGAFQATAQAHRDGGVPNLTINLPARNEYYLGQLYYFFEFSVAVSGLLLGINPFDQPGVEAYKNNMFKLLGKPGY